MGFQASVHRRHLLDTKSGDGRARPLHLNITLQAPEQPILKVAGGSHQGLLQLFEASWEPGQKSGPGEGPGWVTKWARGSWLGDKTWPTAMKARCHIDSIHLDCNVKGAPPGLYGEAALGAVAGKGTALCPRSPSYRGRASEWWWSHCTAELPGGSAGPTSIPLGDGSEAQPFPAHGALL